jgi:hypothetical protein
MEIPMQERRKGGCSVFSPLCMTFIFMFGCIIGMILTDLNHYPLIRNILVVVFATVAFHITNNGSGILKRIK